MDLPLLQQTTEFAGPVRTYYGTGNLTVMNLTQRIYGAGVYARVLGSRHSLISDL